MEIKLTTFCFLFRKRFLMIIMRTFIFLCFTTVFALTPDNVVSQNSKIKIEKTKTLTVDEVFDLIMDQTDYKFFYEEGIFNHLPKVEVKKGIISTNKLLKNSLSLDNLEITVTNNNTILIKEKPKKSKVNVQQGFELSGTITDTNGQPLPGANILEKGTDNGTQTDIDGSFTINISDKNATLVISYLGYLTQEVAVDGKSSLKITLQENAAALDQILITGIRASQQRSVAIKRNSVGFVDAITAESAGKLPDANLAEALQRVAGVSISRTRGQGDFISIRGLGPEFSRGSLNGRSIVSASTTRNTVLSGGTTIGTGRATNFDVLPSDIIETIEVFKTSAAEHIEGGIGGSVNIKTAKPITLGNKFGFNVKGVSFMGRGISPSISGYGSWANKDETFGVLASISYSNRKIREDAARTFAYRLASQSGALAGTAFENEIFPFSSLPEIIEEDRERFTINSSLQWKPSEKTDIVADITYSKRNLDYIGRQANIRVNPLNGTNPVLESIVVENGSVQSWTGGSPIFLSTNTQFSEDDIFSTGINISQELGKWTGILDVSYGGTATKFVTSGAALRVPGGDPNFIIPYNTTIGNEGFIEVESLTDFDFSDSSNYTTRNTGFGQTDITDGEFATKLDFNRKLNGFFSEFKTGLRYRSRSRANDLLTQDGPIRDTDGNPLLLSPTDLGITLVGGSSDFLNGEYSNGLYSEFVFIPNVEEWRAAHEAAGGVISFTDDPNNAYKITENTAAIYAQLDIDHKLGSIPLKGNVGVRVISTDISVTGDRQNLALTPLDPNDPDPNAPQIVSFVGNLVPFENTGNYVSVLPSVNLKAELFSDFYLRTAYSKTITRPQFVNMAGFSYNATNRVANSVGNPGLEPYESSNFDIGLEWYTGSTGAIGFTFFNKSLSSYVTPVNFLNVEDFGVVWDSYNTFDNQGKGNISGAEITFQQPLKFLPGKLKGLGVIANFTFTNGNLELNDGTEVAFPGISDFSYNTALYFDNGGKFQGRLAYTFRDDFLILASDVFGQEQYNDSYGQLDASLSYKVTKNITVFGEGINLTNERNILYSSNQTNPANGLDRPTAYEITGVRGAFGIRASF